MKPWIPQYYCISLLSFPLSQVVNRNRGAEDLKGKPGYVPHLSLHTPAFTAKDYRTWRMFDHRPSTRNQ